MNHIEVAILNPEAVQEAEKLMVCGARLTQRGHNVRTMDDLLELYERPYTPALVQNLASLPHPTIQKLATVTIGVMGASRRFLAQITRHQNEVKFISASLQYSDYTGKADFVVPYEVISQSSAAVQHYKVSCIETMKAYDLFADMEGVGNDAAGYLMPQALRNVLLISATPYQWKHMISQRICRRNSPETRYVMLMIWDELMRVAPDFFLNAGAFCQVGKCQEGKMACGTPMKYTYPNLLLQEDFPLLMKE